MTDRKAYKQAVHLTKSMSDIGVSDIQRHLGVNFAKAHDLLMMMIKMSVVDQDENNGRCRIIKK